MPLFRTDASRRPRTWRPDGLTHNQGLILEHIVFERIATFTGKSVGALEVLKRRGFIKFTTVRQGRGSVHEVAITRAGDRFARA